MQNEPHRFDVKSAIALALTLVFWASAYVAIRAGLSAYSPGELASLRYVTASVALAGYFASQRARWPARKDWPLLALVGFSGITVYNLALNAGEVRVTAAAASFIINIAPVLTAILATWFLREHLHLRGWLGVLISFAGAAFIAFGESGGLKLEPAALLVLVATLAEAVFFVSQKPLLDRYTALEATAPAIWIGTAFLLPWFPSALSKTGTVPLEATLAVVYLGIFPGAIAFVTWAYVLARMPASRASSFLYVIPAITVLIGWLWLGEMPALLTIIGGAVALGGVVLVNKK